MVTLTGTNGIDYMRSGYVSEGVTPAGRFPSEDPDTLIGLASNDHLEGIGGNDTLNGGTGDDTLSGDGSFTQQAGEDVLYGEDGRDTLYGNDNNDELHGGNEDDTLYGQEGSDRLYGDAGKDHLEGGSDNDTLNGGAGQDTLYGESGSDFFVFNAVSDSAVNESRDVIKDFQSGVDKIDFSKIGTFAFMGEASSPTGPGQIIVFNDANGQTIVQLHTNNDATPESEIALDDGSVLASAYTAENFILSAPPVTGTQPETSVGKPEIGQVQTFREGDLVFFRLSYTDPNNDAEGFGFRGINGSGWAEETHPFSSPSYGRVSPGTVEYPFNHACAGSPYESDVEAWIYDSTGLTSAPVPVHLSCSAPSEVDLIGGTT